MTKFQEIPFYRHDLGEDEINMLREVLSQPILTTGEFVEKAENAISDYLGVENCLCVSSCTGALHMALLALGIGPGDEVITTPLTFIATSTAILEAGATPIFVDVEPDTGNLDVSKIETAITNKTKAIIPVHLFGLMCDMRALKEVAERNNLYIIEDAAHCIEGKRDGVRPGNLGDVACFSFYATKNITCGEGGALVTRNLRLYEKLKLLRLHGMTKTAADRAREGYTHWDMLTLGWKYNMSNIDAAILLPQFLRINKNLAKRQKLSDLYITKLSNIKGLRLLNQKPITNNIHAHHLFPILVNKDIRDDIIIELQKRKIGVVVNYRAIHLLSYFKTKFNYERGAFPIAEDLGDSILSLPFYPNMSYSDVDIVADTINKIIN